MNTRMRDNFLLLAVGWWLLAPAFADAAPALVDPTRPAGFARAASTPAMRGAASGADTAVPVPVMPKLQSLQVSAQGESSALVDGRVVRVGDRLGETRVVVIDAQGILLRGPRYEQRIALVPGGGKTVSKTVNGNVNGSGASGASGGNATILLAPLITQPASAVVVVPKEPQ